MNPGEQLVEELMRERGMVASKKLPTDREVRAELFDHDMAAESAQVELLGWLLSRGSTWEDIIKRCFAVAMATRAELLLGMDCCDVDVVFGQVRGAMSARVYREYNQPLQVAGCRNAKAPFQRHEESRAVYALRQMGRRSHAKKLPAKKAA